MPSVPTTTSACSVRPSAEPSTIPPELGELDEPVREVQGSGAELAAQDRLQVCAPQAVEGHAQPLAVPGPAPDRVRRDPAAVAPAAVDQLGRRRRYGRVPFAEADALELAVPLAVSATPAPISVSWGACS
jgi:hypothetical protein